MYLETTIKIGRKKTQRKVRLRWFCSVYHCPKEVQSISGQKHCSIYCYPMKFHILIYM